MFEEVNKINEGTFYTAHMKTSNLSISGYFACVRTEPFVWQVEPTKEELTNKLSTATRSMEHMNSLLHESEATNAILMEQISVSNILLLCPLYIPVPTLVCLCL